MEIALKCMECGGTYELASKTRRRVIYKCVKCGKELPVRKHPKEDKNQSE